MARVGFRDLFRNFYGALEGAGIPYFAYGGVAVGVWGDPRETQDVDAVAVIEEEDCEAISDAIEHAGFAPMQPRRFLPIDGWMRYDYRGRHADMALGRTPFDRSALGRRIRMTMYEMAVWVASAEDLVLYKLIAHRLKDLVDAEAVLVRQGRRLDSDYLRKWADEIAIHTRKFEVPQKLEELLRRV